MNYGARFYDAAVGRWWCRDPKAEDGQIWSPYVYTFNSPINLVDPDGNLPWEPRNVREARRYAKKTGGEFQKWLGQNGYWYASVSWRNRDGAHIVSRVFRPELNFREKNPVYNIFDWAFGWTDRLLPDGYSDPVNSGLITEEDVRVGFGIISLLFSGGAIAETGLKLSSVLEGLNALNTFDDVLGDNKQSYVEKKINDSSTKKMFNSYKLLINTISFFSNVKNIDETVKSVNKLGGTIISGKSI